jgi:hypothetical protein
MQHVFLQNDFVELDDVRMVELHERLYFSQTDTGVPLVVLLFHLLYSHNFTYVKALTTMIS